MSGGSHPELALRAAAVQVEGCKDCTPASWVEEGGRCTCSRWALVELFRQQVEELQEEVSRLCCTREGAQEIEYYLRHCKKKY